MKINKVIKVFIVSDLFLNLGWGFLAPVFAIFIVQKITLGDISEGVKVAGFAAFIYWATKSILQIPIGRYLDKNHGEKDDFLFMIIGMFLASFVPVGFLIAYSPWHIYLLQVIHAAGMAMVFPPWLAIFTRHIDQGKEAFEWSVESTAIGVGAGIAGGVGGILVSLIGFQIVFVLVSGFSFFSTLLLLLVKKEMISSLQVKHQIPPSRPL